MYRFWRRNKVSGEVQEERASRKPNDTPLSQQRMKAWKLVYTHGTSITTFFCIGLVFFAMGSFWLASNKKMSEIRIDYTKCHEIDLEDVPELIPSENIKQHFKASSAGQPLAQWMRSNGSITFDGITKNYTLCTINFFLPDDLQPPVLFYYQLTNFYQNHRKYVTSLDEAQLNGQNVSLSSIGGSCSPVITGSASMAQNQAQEKIVYPCGAIANSIFNDTFLNPHRIIGDSRPDLAQLVTYNMSKTGIASAHEKPFFNPTKYPIPLTPDGNEEQIIVPPPNWAERYPRGYHAGNMFDPADDEAFMVWMHTAASPSFAKLAMRNNEDVMQRGRYELQVYTHFPAHTYGGTKSFVISTASWGVERNSYLSAANMASGAISITLAAIVALSTLHKQKALKDHEYLYRK